MTLAEWLRQGEQRLLGGPHPERARRDAELLLLHLLGRNRAWLMAHTDEPFGGCTAIGYGALLDRRAQGEPIQYITGETEFYGLPFRVTPDVLIPRPETEHLVEKALELAGAWAAPRIVDVGTGSGAIAVALACQSPQAAITAIDLSPAALQMARENAERNGVAGRIRFCEGDLLGPVAGERFELVVSNPPYVAEVDREMLAVEVREHEPALALFAGDDGLGVYRRLIPAAYARLTQGGSLLLEIGQGQFDAVSGLLAEVGFGQIEFIRDLQGIRRVALGRRG